MRTGGDPLAPPEGYGVKPGQEPEPDPERCDFVTQWQVAGSCPHWPAYRLWFGDEREHISQADICPCHLNSAVTMTANCQDTIGGPGKERQVCGQVHRLQRIVELATGRDIGVLRDGKIVPENWTPKIDFTKLSPAGQDRFA